LNIVVTGTRTQTKTFTLNAGQSTVLTLNGLPAGAVTMQASAGSTCTATAEFQSPVVSAFLQPGQTTSLTFAMTPVATVSAAVDFFQWEPVLLNPQSVLISTLGGTSAGDVYAATESSQVFHSTDRGQTWTTQIPASFIGAAAVWATSASAVYLAGYDGNGGGYGAGVVDYSSGDGSWSTIASLGLPLFGGAGSSATDIFAVGIGILAHYNGSAWTVSYSAPWYTGVWENAAGDAFAVAALGATIAHYSASSRSWAVQTVTGAGAFRGVWGSGADVYAVGQNSAGTAPVIFHTSDGTNWTSQALPAVRDNMLLAVTGAGGVVYAAGGSTVLQSTNGGPWTVNTTAAVDDSFNAMWSSGSDVYLAGQNIYKHVN
jgi:hypothetical protein